MLSPRKLLIWYCGFSLLFLELNNGLVISLILSHAGGSFSLHFCDAGQVLCAGIRGGALVHRISIKVADCEIVAINIRLI